jgi:putative ABC transport system permease protein
VIGPNVGEALFPMTDPIGKQVLINGHPFVVVGVLAKSKGGFLGEGNERDNAVQIPYQTFHKMMPWEDKHFLLIQAKNGMLPKAMDEVESLLRRRRGVKPNEANNFDLSTADRIIQQFDSITAMIGLIAIAISGIGLLVGGIGVMNIMLVSVTERTREIGVRKALGAPRKAILTQFLVEAVLLTAGGGVAGVLLGAGISWLVRSASPLPTYVSAWSVVTGLAFSAVVGVFFGLYPAVRASRLDPVDSLRYE